ncbi:MAG: DAK2 domain-containing protein [Oscillospiraceae bacterium]|nr:DAK2 domain-containing protein [Oscillospiraceae bacterium]
MIQGKILKNAIISGANNLYKSKNFVNELNIFPVPDGDTGTNMSMTVMAAVNELEKQNEADAGHIAKLVSSALLRGARGNSGVILSLIFRGFAKGLADITEASGRDMVRSLGFGVESAYSAVMKPTEGTMLTVARVAFESGKQALLDSDNVSYVWDKVCKGAHEALKDTPNLLPVLKKAGVVDAGGKGLCLIFEGMLSVFSSGKIIEKELENIEVSQDDMFKSAAAVFDEDIKFTYCTEYIVGKNRMVKANPLKLRKKLERLGDCVVVVDDDDIIKVHVHTEHPDRALKEGLYFGSLLTVKIENMKEQHKEAARQASEKSVEKKQKKLEFQEPVNEVGFVAVSAGEGLETMFKDLGCDKVICGGQTMNPSTDQILEAIMATPAKTVYVLPNNKNIIMAAEQSVSLVQDRNVIVIPSKTIPQGISAMLAFNSSVSSHENAEAMKRDMAKVETGQITFAARDSEFGGFKIKEGSILALSNGKLVFTENDPVKAAIRLIKFMIKRETEYITVIYGESISKGQADELLSFLNSKYQRKIDINMVEGNQPVYHFIISLE